MFLSSFLSPVKGVILYSYFPATMLPLNRAPWGLIRPNRPHGGLFKGVLIFKIEFLGGGLFRGRGKFRESSFNLFYSALFWMLA